MKECSVKAKGYILGVIFCGFALLVYEISVTEQFSPELILPAGLASIAQTRKVDGPTDRSNYNISWVSYVFSFLLYNALRVPAL